MGKRQLLQHVLAAMLAAASLSLATHAVTGCCTREAGTYPVHAPLDRRRLDLGRQRA